MGAKQNVVIVGLREQATFGKLLTLLLPFIESTLGALRIFSVVKPRTDELRDEVVVGDLERYVSGLADDELGTFYAADPKRGSVGFAREGVFDVVVMSLSDHRPPVSLCRTIWRVVGSVACAVLVGEELEVRDDQIEELLATASVPHSLDLCESAIVRPLGEVAGGHESLDHGGIRLK
jgi:hypothetical protein